MKTVKPIMWNWRNLGSKIIVEACSWYIIDAYSIEVNNEKSCWYMRL